MTKASGQTKRSTTRAGEATPAWAWGAGNGPAVKAPDEPARPPRAATDDEVAVLRVELEAARAEATALRRQLEEERAAAAVRCEGLERRAEAALIQARADADALNAVALAARATESRASALAEEVATLRARRRLFGRSH